MRKEQELSDPNSCLNRARPGEMMFVLLGRDLDACGTVRDWIERRVRRGKATRQDPEIISAEEWIIETLADQEAEFITNNTRRIELAIKKEHGGGLNEKEAAEFDRLQQKCFEYLDTIEKKL